MVNRRILGLILKIPLLLLALAAAAGFALLQVRGGKLLSVASGSMAPVIQKGSLVQVNRVPARDIAVGDVITYVSADKKYTVTHRVTALLEDDPAGNRFVTKGDANAEADVPIEAASVIGRVERSVPYAGYAVDFIKQPLGLIAIIYIPALLIIIHETKRLAAYYRLNKPYLMYGFSGRIIKPSKGHAGLIVAGIMLLAVAGFSGRALALNDQAALLGSTITVADIEEPLPPPPPPPKTEVTCTNSTNVNINSQTNQMATSGDAVVEGNTTGGSATSGDATNSSSTSVNVNVNNTNCSVPTTPTP